MYAEIVFMELEKELKRNPKIIGTVKGIFKVTILENTIPKGVWFVYLNAENPMITRTIVTECKDEVNVEVELEDKILLKMISGGMTGIKAYTSKLISIKGDLVLAKQAEKVFIKAGGVEKVMAYIKKHYPNSSSKL